MKDRIAAVAEKLDENYSKQEIFEVNKDEKLPKRSEIIELLNEIRRIMFPGFFGSENAEYLNLNYFAGNVLADIYERMYKQVNIAFLYQNRNNEDARTADFSAKAEAITCNFIDRLAEIQELIFKDVEAELQGDPAAGSKEEIIFSYPGIFAIYVYRIAHILYELEVPFIPRIMSEHAHSQTGIDINPGATIGEYFFIDHGTGIVIGETTEIGDHVKIYQGVTLGALSTMKGQALSGVKRHPTIEDNVVIYANTTILGGNTVVGANSVVAGNTFLVESIPSNTKVSTYVPELQMKKR